MLMDGELDGEHRRGKRRLLSYRSSSATIYVSLQHSSICYVRDAWASSVLCMSVSMQLVSLLEARTIRTGLRDLM